MDSTERREPEEPKKSDEIKEKLLRIYPWIEKPFEQWSDDEKGRFMGFSNNFYRYLPGGPALEGNYLNGKRDISIREASDMNDELVEHDVRVGIHSEKYLNGTFSQFIENIKNSLIGHGIDVNDLANKVKLSYSYRKVALKLQIDSPEWEELAKKEADLQANYLLEILPVFLDLIDSGYTELDLMQ